MSPVGDSYLKSGAAQELKRDFAFDNCFIVVFHSGRKCCFCLFVFYTGGSYNPTCL